MESLLLQKWKRALEDPDFVKKCEQDGVDLSLLFSTMSQTPTERAENNRALLGFIEEAGKARAKRALNAHS